MKILLAMISLMVLASYAKGAVSLNCEAKLGPSVYTSFTLVFSEMSDKPDLPYNLKGLEGSEVLLEGKINTNHPDAYDGTEWSFATGGLRKSVIEDDYYKAEGLGFNIETCKDCDFNGATYQYRKTSDSEIFITEMYGSDGSAGFSIYACTKL